MPIKRGDSLILNQHGREIAVIAASDEADGTVQIKYKGAFSTASVHDLRAAEVWVLTDPDGGNVDGGGPIFVRPDGQTTGNKHDAHTFPSQGDAEAFRDSHSGIPYFVPRKYDEA